LSINRKRVRQKGIIRKLLSGWLVGETQTLEHFGRGEAKLSNLGVFVSCYPILFPIIIVSGLESFSRIISNKVIVL
jgi:hypothetical protein